VCGKKKWRYGDIVAGRQSLIADLLITREVLLTLLYYYCGGCSKERMEVNHIYMMMMNNVVLGEMGG